MQHFTPGQAVRHIDTGEPATIETQWPLDLTDEEHQQAEPEYLVYFHQRLVVEPVHARELELLLGVVDPPGVDCPRSGSFGEGLEYPI